MSELAWLGAGLVCVAALGLQCVWQWKGALLWLVVQSACVLWVCHTYDVQLSSAGKARLYSDLHDASEGLRTFNLTLCVETLLARVRRV